MKKSPPIKRHVRKSREERKKRQNKVVEISTHTRTHAAPKRAVLDLHGLCRQFQERAFSSPRENVITCRPGPTSIYTYAVKSWILPHIGVVLQRTIQLFPYMGIQTS
jgi:hypothetical protein